MRKAIRAARRGRAIAGEAWERRGPFLREARRLFVEGPTRFRGADRTNRLIVVGVLAALAVVVALVV